MKYLNLNLIDKLRQENPLILCITNSVTIHDVANVVNYIGASPIMITEPEEIEDILKHSNAIYINIGTINEKQKELIIKTLICNQEYKLPVVLDPVAVGSSNYRLMTVKDILKNYHIDCIRANYGEMATLLQKNWNSHGIDSGSGTESPKILAQNGARKMHAYTVLSGKEDFISDGQNTVSLNFTNSNFTKYVGTGDMLSAVIAAYLAVDNSIEAAITAVASYTACGEMIPKTGPSSWIIHFNDSLASITKNKLEEYINERN